MNSAHEALRVAHSHFPENESHTVAAVSCACRRPFCGVSVPPQTLKRGEPRVYCSDSCRRKHWEELHPRTKPEQARLDFTPIKPTAPVTGEPYESARLWLLARLKQGPVCTLELRREPWPASQNGAQRVLELRNRQYDIRTERRDGKYWYVLYLEGRRVE